MQLRPYQLKVEQELYEGWDFDNPANSPYRRQMLFVPTGGGKTIIFNYITSKLLAKGDSVMILAHRDELIQQAAQKYRAWFGGHADIIKGGIHRTFLEDLKIGSIQTVSRRISKCGTTDNLHLRKVPKLIIFDEGHHIGASTYKKVIDYFPDSLILAVTATPCRLTGEGFEDVIDRLVLGPSVKELEQMWKESEGKDTGLCEDKILNILLYSGLRKIKKVRGDYDQKELNKVLNTDRACEAIAEAYIEYAKGKKTIAYVVKGESKLDGKRMHQRLSEHLQKKGIKADYIDAKTEDRDRKNKLDRLRRGEIEVICNMELFTEGFDAPSVDCILLARPTMSLSLYLQMVGRGKRPDGPQKEHNLVLDFVQNVLLHGRPNTDHEWTIEGVKKREGKTTMVKIGDKLIPFDEMPEVDFRPMGYELVEFDEPYRVQYFDKFFQARKYSKNPYQAGQIAFDQFLKKVKGRPSELELRYIADAIIQTSNRDYKQRWAKEMYDKYSFVMDMVEQVDSPGGAELASQAMAYYMKQLSADKSRMIELPGYDVMRAILNKKKKKMKTLAKIN